MKIILYRNLLVINTNHQCFNKSNSKKITKTRKITVGIPYQLYSKKDKEVTILKKNYCIVVKNKNMDSSLIAQKLPQIKKSRKKNMKSMNYYA